MKFVKISLIVICSLFTLLWILSFSGVFKVYTIPTIANEPNMKLGSRIFATNLKEPKHGDFVCYNTQTDSGKVTRVHRLAGVENDLIEIRNGVLFRNGKNVDENIALIHMYKISAAEHQRIQGSEGFRKDLFAYQTAIDTVQIFLEDQFARSHGLGSKRSLQTNDAGNWIKSIYGQEWNGDNFGPLKIPSNKLFLIGDNRHNSEDSRYLGLADKDDVVGVVIR